MRIGFLLTQLLQTLCNLDITQALFTSLPASRVVLLPLGICRVDRKGPVTQGHKVEELQGRYFALELRYKDIKIIKHSYLNFLKYFVVGRKTESFSLVWKAQIKWVN